MKKLLVLTLIATLFVCTIGCGKSTKSVDEEVVSTESELTNDKVEAEPEVSEPEEESEAPEVEEEPPAIEEEPEVALEEAEEPVEEVPEEELVLGDIKITQTSFNDGEIELDENGMYDGKYIIAINNTLYGIDLGDIEPLVVNDIGLQYRILVISDGAAVKAMSKNAASNWTSREPYETKTCTYNNTEYNVDYYHGEAEEAFIATTPDSEVAFVCTYVWPEDIKDVEKAMDNLTVTEISKF